jgi:lipopolysaccharide assembly outer membrane protein LptD (OstA)
LHNKLHILFILLTFTFLFNTGLYAQDTSGLADTLNPQIDTALIEKADTMVNDSVNTKKKNNSIDLEVSYNAKDSIIFGMDNREVYLYKEAVVSYGTMNLKADYIIFDMTTNEVFATGLPDSTGKMVGKPVFTDNDQVIEADSLHYNFKTSKGYILAVRTEQEGGYLLAEKTKKDELGHIHLKNGIYTTCDAPHPHFGLALTKAISIPGDKIVSGPAYLIIEDVALPIGVPFGFFPNTKTNTSGLLIPSYGEENGRGFYLRNGGYYFAINDYLDLRLTGDIYTNGTWGMRVGSMYKKIYKYNGNINARIYQNINGEKGLPNFSKSSDYSVMWSHSQDSKANPNQTFRASVNLSTRRFDQNHSAILENALTNTKQSSISFQKSWPNSPFNLTASANHSQNSNTGSVDLNLPKVSFNMSRLYPFERKNRTGPKKWYEEIQLSYSSSLDNRIRTVDTLLFTSQVWDNMVYGFKHDIPISWNYKPKKLKSFTFSPNLRYSGVAYGNYIEKRREQYSDADTSFYYTVTDTINKFRYAHSYYPSVSFGLAPKIYGSFQFKKPDSKIVAIRHVMSPSASFTYIPDVSAAVPDYYRELYDEDGNLLEKYSIFRNGIYGTPALGRRVRTMSLSLRNNIEAKVRQENDTTTEYKKIKILDNFNFSSNVNFDDSIKFSPVSINGNTRFFNGKANVSFRGSFDPYAQDSLFRRINYLEYKKNGNIGRLTSAGMSVGMSFEGGSKKGKPDETNNSDNNQDFPAGTADQISNEYDTFDEDYYGGATDFDIPWTLRVDYSLNYSKPRDEATVIQTIRASGSFSLTPKWQFTYQTGYDFKNSKITTSNIGISRDLHCWEMRLTAVPFGIYKSFNFMINVKSAILQDLKYNKRIPWQDNF